MATSSVFASRSFSGTLSLVVFVLFCMLLNGLAIAQSTEQSTEATDEAKQTPNAQGPVTRDQLLALIANEIVLAPGIGLKNIRLGESLGSIQARLGPPASVAQSGILPRFTNLTYLLDGGTVVVLAGREVVERIMVKGNAAALIRTTQGARFGMDPTLIQRIYRGPTKIRGNRIEYANRGVTFYFGEQGGGQGLSDGVSRIEIYPRQI